MSRARLYRPRLGEVIEVEWADAQYDGDFDGQAEAYEGKLAILLNVGYFAKLTKESLVLVSCRQPSNGTMRWFVTIPRNNIRAIRPILSPLLPLPLSPPLPPGGPDAKEATK